MKIAIIGSVSFIKEMIEIKDKLVETGHQVFIPPSAEFNQSKEYWKDVKETNFEEYTRIGRERNLTYFEKIKSSDALLVLNFTKNGIKNYIGPNTLMEMTVAFEHGKKIFLLNNFPEDRFAEDELNYMNPIVLNSDLTKIE